MAYPGPLKIPRGPIEPLYFHGQSDGYVTVILTVIKGSRVGGKSGLVLKGLRGAMVSTCAPIIDCYCITSGNPL